MVPVAPPVSETRVLPERELADALRADAEESAELLQEYKDMPGYFKDSMWQSLTAVNWQEIAKSYIEEVT